MLDITNYNKEISTYGGSELKMTYFINQEKYMVKFPDPIREKNRNISYVNNQYSEYVGCKIFKLLGIDTQDVLLVKCLVNNKEKIAVACKDFLAKDETLIEFKNLSYSLNVEKKYTSSIEDIYEMINNLPNLENKKAVINEFWRRVIVDALLGNNDRHLGNWAFIKRNNKYYLAPVYDCGSCLNPLLTKKEMATLLNDEIELKNVAYNVKTPYKLKDKSVSYQDIFKNMPQELKEQIKEIVPKIDLNLIKQTIEEITALSQIQKEFYYKTIAIRKKFLLDKALKQVENSN